MEKLTVFKMIEAFFFKDIKVFLSYKFNLAITAINIMFLTAFIFLFSSSIELNIQSKYASNPFNFFLFGLIITELSVRLVSNIPNTLRGYQLSGVIESIFMDNRHSIMLIVAGTTFPVFLALIRMGLYLILSFFLVDEFQLIYSNLHIGFLVILVSVVSFVSIGLLSAYFTLNFKIANPIFLIYSAIILLFSGALIPLDSIPESLSWLSYILPNTYAIEILREINTSPELSESVSSNIIFLLLLTFVYFAAGIYVAKMGIRHSKISGNFGHY